MHSIFIQLSYSASNVPTKVSVCKLSFFRIVGIVAYFGYFKRRNNISKVPFSCLVLFRDYWITFYNFTFWRPNFTRTSSLVIQRRSEKNYSFQIFVADMCHKSRSSQTVSHNQSLTISVKKYVFWVHHGSKQTQTIKNKRFS